MKRFWIGALLLLTVAGCAPRAGTASAAHTTFVPAAGTHWQIQLSGTFDASVTADVYDLDPYATETATAFDLTALGHKVICHLDVGVSDETLPDATRLPAGVLGASDGTDRRWLDIRRWSLIEPVLADRLDLCRTKGFQAVDADGMDGYAHTTGFDLTSAEQVTFDHEVAELAHTYGLAAGIRTPPGLAPAITPFVDFTVVDGCFAAPDCAGYSPFVQAGKAVYDLETRPGTAFCALARAYGFAAIRKPDPTLDGRVQPC